MGFVRNGGRLGEWTGGTWVCLNTESVLVKVVSVHLPSVSHRNQ